MISVKNRIKYYLTKQTEIVHFTHFHTFPTIPKNTHIPKKSLKRVKSSNLGTKSLEVRALCSSLKYVYYLTSVPKLSGDVILGNSCRYCSVYNLQDKTVQFDG